MENLIKLRESADFLYKYSHFEEAYNVYEQIYLRIWFALGYVLAEMNKFSSSFITGSFKATVDFKNDFNAKSAGSVFKKWYNLDLDQVWNELLFCTYYELQCVNNSDILTSQIPQQRVIKKFLIVYYLINNTQEKWVNTLLRFFTPVVKENQIEKIRINLPEKEILRNIVSQAENIKLTDWSLFNNDLLEYLHRVKEIHSKFYTELTSKIGPYKKNTGRREDKKQENQKEHYEKYERYEKYEKYERYEKFGNPGKNEFNPKTATDFEKENYYGKILGLQGKLTKSQIRKKYLEMITKYHPDKVNDLGEEFIRMAETKTRDIIEAYQWISKKYSI